MPEQYTRLTAVGGDLRLQEIQRFELTLVTEPLNESDPDRCAVQVPLQVEDVRLDRRPARRVDGRPRRPISLVTP